MARRWLDDEYGRLLAARADADQRRALDVVMGIEDGLDAFGEQRAVGGFHAMRLAAAVPEAARFVEIADVAHAMPGAEAGGWEPVRFTNLAVGIALGSRYVSGRRLWPADDELADFARAVAASAASSEVIGLVGDSNHAPFDRAERSPDADAAAELGPLGRFAQNLGGFDRGDGQAFGRAVRRVHLGIGRDAVERVLDHVGRHGRAARKDLSQGSNSLSAKGAESAEPFPDSGRSEGLCHLPIVGSVEQFERRGGGRVRKIHLGENRRHAHRRIEEREEREAGEVDAAGGDRVGRLNFGDLRVEHAMRVEDAFGWAGAAGGEDDGGGVVGVGFGNLGVVGRGAAGRQFPERHPAPAPAAADRHVPDGVAESDVEESFG